MKIYLSVDMEGVACIVNPVQVIPPSLGPRSGFKPDALAYERGKKLLTGEVKAAVERIDTACVRYVSDDFLDIYRLIRLFLNLANVAFAA
ncbi:MAG: M55 family metallopeptidase [Anaerolineales bacterium]|nr:M55 family metallopeptidase [Anaerolineales bacterium]